MPIVEAAIVLAPGTPLPAPFPQPRQRASSPYWVYLAHLDGKESERTMRGCLDRLAVMIAPDLDGASHPGESVPWEEIRYPHAIAIRKQLTERGWSPSHINKHLCALRGVTRESWRLGLMGADDMAKVCDIRSVKFSRELTGRNIHPEEIAAILTACLAEPGPLGIRDAAMVALLHSTGLRRDEVAAALIERYDPGERGLKIIGKGDKERTVYVHPAAVRYLDRWLVTVGARRGPMFRPVDKHGNVGARPLSARTVGHAIDRRHTEAGVPPTSTHDFRRTFVGDFIDAGGDLVQAQQLAGHASATTTARYDRRPGRERRAAVDRLSLPSPEELSPR
jgi:site-specific recombinase XerD